MKKHPKTNVKNIMKYWFGTINIYVWTIKNPFLITKTYENNKNTSNFQFSMKIFFEKNSDFDFEPTKMIRKIQGI